MTTLTAAAAPVQTSGFTGLTCANCGADAPIGPNFICGRGFGPLRAT